jgi:hypothetical protein
MEVPPNDWFAHPATDGVCIERSYIPVGRCFVKKQQFKVKHAANVLETGVDEGIIRPMLIITPDSYANGMWADSKSGHKPSETHLIR